MSTETTVSELPVADGCQRVTNREIVRIYSALTALSQRRLMGPDNEKKVVRLLRRHFNEAHEEIQERKKINIRNLPVPSDWDGESLPIAVAEARSDAWERLMDETQDIPTVPEHLYLTDADMPKPIKGESGDQNQFSVAEIKNLLGFLYPVGDDDA
jgi:hypothetical protein